MRTNLSKESRSLKKCRYTDAIIAWQQVLQKEPGKHTDIETLIKDAMEKVKAQAEAKAEAKAEK